MNVRKLDFPLVPKFCSINSVPGDDSADETASKAEILMLKADCDLITMMDPVAGRLEITTRNLYFFELNTAADKIGTSLQTNHCTYYI